MKYNEMVNEVKTRINIDSDEAAERAISATLSTLGERITAGEAEHLSAQLPFEAGRHLTEQETKKDFGIDQFYETISQRESIGFPMAKEHARAVMSVMSEMVTPGEMQDTLDHLPEEHVPLFTFSSSDWRKL